MVGNPPFIGNKRMRPPSVMATWKPFATPWPEVPETVDFVMYWWKHAAELAREGTSRHFGLITTNSHHADVQPEGRSNG